MSGAPRILLVEDEVIAAMVMTAELAAGGLPVARHVTTGEAAIVYASAQRPDLIIMDIRLAGRIDGIETALRIRTEYPAPFIFITGFDDSAVKERTVPLQPLGYLIKPIAAILIKSIIESHFS